MVLPDGDLAGLCLCGRPGCEEHRWAEVVDRLRVPFMASNFGAPRTLVEQSTVFTYFEYSDNELVSIGVPRGTVRVTLGYSNDVADIIKDLDQALSHVPSRAGDSVAS